MHKTLFLTIVTLTLCGCTSAGHKTYSQKNPTLNPITSPEWKTFIAPQSAKRETPYEAECRKHGYSDCKLPYLDGYRFFY